MRAALIALALLAAPAVAQEATPAAAPVVAQAPKPKTNFVTLTTAQGPILIELEVERAPLTAANFLRYVDQKRLDGTVFYRAMNIQPNYGLIQGGTRGNPKLVLKPVAHEPTSKTGLSHTDGAISMARAAPGSANGDFFITVGALTALDADLSKPGDNLGFAVFGHVVEGMDVVRKIVTMPAGGGEGAMKGQILTAPVKILTARRAKPPALMVAPPATLETTPR